MEYYIAIPTRGRVGGQKTLNKIHPELLKYFNIWCHPGELCEHERLWGDKVNSIQEYGIDCDHIGSIRDYIIENCGSERVLFMDDNIDFSVRMEGRKSPVSITCKNFTDEEIKGHQLQILNFLHSSLEEPEVGITGLSFRPFNRGGNEDIEFNKRFFAVWGLDVEKYKGQEVRLRDWDLKEDFALGIGMVKSGRVVAVSFLYCFDKTNGANSKGGCSTYRNIERHNNSALKLQETFPDVVSIKKRNNKNWGGEFKGVENLDVVIKWSKI